MPGCASRSKSGSEPHKSADFGGLGEHLETLHSTVERFTYLRDAIRLLKRWAASCGFMAARERASTPLNGLLGIEIERGRR